MQGPSGRLMSIPIMFTVNDMDRIRPKKSLGQNFLTDGNIVSKILAAANIAPEDGVLEIGPGRGALTLRLADMAGRLVAVEWDRDMVPLLAETLGRRENVTLVHGDILRVDFQTLLARCLPVWKVVANLPYNISSQILFKFIDNRELFSELVLMLQKEVGERLLAPPDTKEYGVLTVLCRLYFDIEKICIVKPGSFHPSPKVDSMVLRFRVLPGPRIDVGDELTFRRVVKASFAQRRKTLANCIRNMEPGLDATLLSRVFGGSGINGGRRGETLSLDEFALLTKQFL
jgi:16S rRNA (adenine1518-N6/adenine1519-N6)-dimethyltransferase